jgi:hypothetical protein
MPAYQGWRATREAFDALPIDDAMSTIDALK